MALLYRLQRIEKIAGVRLNDPETLLMLHLALRAGQVLLLTRGASADDGATHAPAATDSGAPLARRSAAP